MKRQKDQATPSNTNGAAQVFVLPPEILEKLGIQLSNIECSTATNEVKSEHNEDINNDLQEIPDDVANSSILETANLMKQSVFMSPTFVNSNGTANENIVSNTSIQMAESINDVTTDYQLEVLNDNIKKIKNPAYNLASKDYMKYELINEYEVDNDSGDLILTNASKFYNNPVVNDLTVILPGDEHADEAYSSDCSNSNSGAVSENTNNNLQTTEYKSPSNKIKILSEQIIHNSDLNNIKKTQIRKKNSCFLIPVNTIVTGKVTKDCPNKESKDNLEEFCIATEKVTEIGNVSIVKNNITMEDVYTNKQDVYTKKHLLDTLKNKITVKLELDNLENCSHKIFHKTENSQLKTNKKIGITEEKLKVNMVCNNAEEASNTENTLIKSKLSIQGVEKPGGTRESNFDNVLKTYQRNNKQKLTPKLSQINNTEIVLDNYLLENVGINVNDINIGGFKDANQFCICSDYGRLTDYDCDVYEHLHFHDHKKVVCDLETLLSLYDDDASVLHDRTEMKLTDTIDDAVETTEYNICYISLMSKVKEDEEEPVTFNRINKYGMEPDKPRSCNRRSKSITEHLVEEEELKSKKTLKCDTCGLLVLKAEWNKHKDSAHALIAWKDDQQTIKSSSLNQDEITGKDKQIQKSQSSRKSPRLSDLGISCFEPGNQISPDKKKMPKTLKEETKDHKNLKDTLKSEAKNSGVKSKRTSTTENKNSSKSNMTNTTKSNKTIKGEKSTAQLVTTIITPNENKNSKNTSYKKNIPEPKKKESEKVKSHNNEIMEMVKPKLEVKNIPNMKTKYSPKAELISTVNTMKTSTESKRSISENNEVIKSPNSTRTSIAESIDTPKDVIRKGKATPKLDVPHTRISKRRSNEERKYTSTEEKIILKETSTSNSAVKSTPESWRKSETKYSPKSPLKAETEDTPKTTRRYSGVEVKHNLIDENDSKLILKNIVADVLLESHTTVSSCQNKDLTGVVYAQSKIKFKEKKSETTNEVATGTLKEIDLFSSTSSFKHNTTTSPKKSVTMSQNAHSNIIKMSINVLDQSQKSNSEVESSINLKRKSIGASAQNSKRLKDENKSLTIGECASERKSTDKDTIKEESMAKMLKKNINSPKSDTPLKIAYTKSSRLSAETTARPLKVNDSTKKEGQIIRNTEVVSAKTTTTSNSTTSQSTSQSTAAGSSSSTNTEQNEASSSNINSPSKGSDKDNPPPVDKSYFIEIKLEVKSKCAVCKQEVDDFHWLEHIAKEHNYLAWRENEIPLDLENDEAVRAHLGAIAKRHGELKCFKCNTVRKYVKAYRTHVRNCGLNESQWDVSTASMELELHDPDDVPLSKCKAERRTLRNAVRISSKDVSSDNVDAMNTSTVDDEVNTSSKSNTRRKSRKTSSLRLPREVVCAVCNETVLEDKWIDHIRLEHKYLAWQTGEPPLNVNDDIEVKIFLQNISKHNGGLICSKCGVVRFYVKKWFEHEATCTGGDGNESSSSEDFAPIAKKPNANKIKIEILPDVVKCGKCSKEMPSETWINHNETEHSYLAWIEGQPPLDNDPEALNAHLYTLVKQLGSLKCAKCGLSRKYPKAFLTHVNACTTSGFKCDDYYVEVSANLGLDEYECAVCLGRGLKKDWKKHSMGKHYNIAWMTGQMPINLKNPYAVEKYLKEYRTKHNLVCKVCGASRSSYYGFYAHILTCGKSETELEPLMNLCDICNNKYLCIYRNQHVQMHREQQRKDERKEKEAIMAEERNRLKDDDVPMGKRRAAERAKKVMEKYTSDKQDGTHVCVTCKIGFDDQNQLRDHVCQETPQADESDSDVSVKMEGQEESDDDMDVDSNISDEEEQDSSKRKKMFPETQPKIILPFKVNNYSRYLEKSFENFSHLHFTSASLFNDWRCKEWIVLSEKEASNYLPSLSNSCKILLGDEWGTMKRFEALKKRDIMTLFTGASIRCMQWVPKNLDSEQLDNYLSVVCFQHADCPRYEKDDLPQHPGMIQIWNIGKFTSKPKLEFGIAHDYGTIWAMDWCPSGGRDLAKTDRNSKEDGRRLGLLAVACSNGSAYVLSVPLIQNQDEAEPKICRLKPVAELRISMKPKEDSPRARYQATSISWSPQKGHELVTVGYADGTTAFYNLTTSSPFLKSIENGLDIFYPFHDSLAENSPVTGIALSASQDLRRIIGGVASSSVTGATMAGWPRAGPVLRSPLAASSIAATPHWPAALLCSDDVLTAKAANAMEWCGGGRRLGGACAAGGCARCGRLCVAAPPNLRLMLPHPASSELKKQIIATMKMVPLAQKRKLKTDDLGMVVEPLTYDETILKYGLEFVPLPKKIQKASKMSSTVEQCPERFPLSEMPAVAFCPSTEHHNRLAVATHAGFIFIINT